MQKGNCGLPKRMTFGGLWNCYEINPIPETVKSERVWCFLFLDTCTIRRPRGPVALSSFTCALLAGDFSPSSWVCRLTCSQRVTFEDRNHQPRNQLCSRCLPHFTIYYMLWPLFHLIKRSPERNSCLCDCAPTHYGNATYRIMQGVGLFQRGNKYLQTHEQRRGADMCWPILVSLDDSS